MARRMGDLLAQRTAESFVGRRAELATLLQSLEEDSPLVVHVHGIAGVGKSALLRAFSAQARARGATVVCLDCRAIEPTERGFLHELSAAIGGDAPTTEETAARLGRLGKRVVLALDTYEVFRLMDTWLRQVFLPALGDNVRVVLAGRQPPVPAWLTSPEWPGLFRSMSLGPLSDSEALELLLHAGITKENAQRINRFARGHPLALVLEAALQRLLRVSGSPASYQEVLGDLEAVRAVRFEARGKAWLWRNELAGRAYEAFQAVGVRPPDRAQPLAANPPPHHPVLLLWNAIFASFGLASATVKPRSDLYESSWLLHRHRFCQIAWLIRIAPPADS